MCATQTLLLAKLNHYLASLGRSFTLTGGYCHGLALLWLYQMSINQAPRLYQLIQRICDNHFECEDKEVEKLIAYLEWLQHASRYMSHVNQLDIEPLLELNKELSLVFLFREDEIEKILASVVTENKMISISSRNHTVGIYKKNAQIYFFDANESGLMPIVTEDIKILTFLLARALYHRRYLPASGVPLEIMVFSHKSLGNLDASAAFYDRLIETRTDLNQTGLDNLTSLQLACDSGDEVLAAMLLRHGANPNRSASANMAPLEIATARGYHSIVALLLKFGAITSSLPEKKEVSLDKHESINLR